MKDLKKHLYFIAFLLLLFLISKFLSQEQLQNNESNKLVLQQIQNLSFELKNLYSLHSIFVTTLFCFSFFILTILFIPFTGPIYVLFAGSIFGFYKGVILFSFLISLSYTATFLISRYFLFNMIQKKIGKRGKDLITKFEQDGIVYLLSLRFSGVIPAVIVNTVMGVTNVSIRQFYFTAQIGTLPHIIVWVYAGSTITKIININDIVSDKFFLFIILISILPVAFKIIAELTLNLKNKNKTI